MGINQAELLENKDLREKYMEKVEVLDKVKELLLFDELKMATVQMVADYYEVPKSTIESCVSNHREEVESDGYSVYKVKDADRLLSHVTPDFRVTKNRANFKLINKEGDVILSAGGTGVALFPRRAILRVGMLLQKSDIAIEVRTQLLNIEEKVTKEEKTESIDEEERLLLNIMKAKNNVERAIAVNEHQKYMERYKEKAERYETIYHSDKLYTTTEIAKDCGISAIKLNRFLMDKKIIYKKGNTYYFYANHEDKVPSHADYHITEFGQTMKWTNIGREWIMDLLN